MQTVRTVIVTVIVTVIAGKSREKEGEGRSIHRKKALATTTKKEVVARAKFRMQFGVLAVFWRWRLTNKKRRAEKRARQGVCATF